MIPYARHVHMVALIFACSADLCMCESRAYKVKDSNEEFADRDHSRGFTKSFTGEGSSGGFYGAGFHFPDFFNDGNQDVEGGNGFGLVSPFVSTFPSLSESRSSDTTYILPAHTYSTGNGFDRSNSHIPLSRSSAPGEYESRNSKKPISNLYDDWKPGDEHPRNNKWSQEHVDDDSSEVTSGRNSYPSTPYRGQNNYGRPYSEASLRQHYKPLRPVGKTHGTNYATGEGDARTHQHKYGVSHIYDPKKKTSDEPSYDRYEDKLQDRKPQQFNPNPHHNYKNERPPPPGTGSYSESANRGRSSFKPSPPDYFRNSRADKNFDFFSDSSKLAVKKVKTPNNHEHLDKSCVKTNKTTTINISDGQIFLNCYECFDKKHSRPYEQCVEVSKPSVDKKIAHKRFRRDVNGGSVSRSIPVGREKRQYDDYYEGEGGSYGPDSSDYRFGPEHFTDDYPSTSYDDGEGDSDAGPDYDSEKCSKTRKGEMLCITCENRSGGTYKQCSYASDPKKNSYERSVSKVYGSPRLPEENRRKQVENPPKRPVHSKRRPYSSPPPSGPSGPSGPSDYSSEGPGYSRPTSGGRKGSSRGAPPRNYDGPSTKYRGSEGRSPLPARGSGRSGSRTPASTQLRTSPRSSVRTSPRGLAGSGSPDQYRYLPARNPPPSSRAYSTPSPLAVDPYAYDIPDPYSPDPATLAEGVNVGRHGARNRKNIDPSFDPGYDETFASLFPELVDGVDALDAVDPSSAVALAPPTYDEYPDTGDYDEGPERRTDVRSQHTSRNTSRMPPISDSSITHRRPSNSDSRSFSRDKSSCKKIRKNKMNCYQCVDDKGTKHEECMYVAESEPKSKHMTYREIKELRYDPHNNHGKESRSSQQNHEPGNERPNDNSYRGKRKFKKYDPEEHNKSTSGKDGSGSSWESKMDNQRRHSDMSRDRYNATVDQEGRNSPNGDHHVETREKREGVEDPVEKTDSEIEKSTRKNYNPIPTDPPELDEIGEKHSENGEFSADLELKYDPVLGLSLPKYMLEKSEHEAIFDEVLASGKK